MQVRRETLRVPAHLKIRWGRYRRVRFSGSHQPCRLCGGNDTVVVSRFDRWLNPLVNVMCRGCGLVFLDPMPTDEEINTFYKDQFWLRSQGSDEPTEKTILRASRDGESRLSLLSPLLKPGMRILDVGAGGGEFLVAARRRGFEVDGIEPSLGYARYCQRAYGIAMQSAPLADVNFGDKKFDLITCNHSLEHMRDPLAALRRLHDLLKPDGHLYVSVPNLGDPNAWPLRYFHAGHLYSFSHETLVMMGAKAGFAPLDQQPFGTETTLIFRRLAAPDTNWFRFPDYPAQAEITWRRRTIWRYLLAPRNYRRIPDRIRYFLNDYALLTRRWLGGSAKPPSA
jgi:2-polyprenyl-3-methyl-5-hydroxy-6-metoxy-1,4-benzoquinol methylase